MSPARVSGFLLAQRANADHFPPVLHQAHLLATRGAVRLLDAGVAAPRPLVTGSGAIERRRVTGSHARAGRLLEITSFVNAFRTGLARDPAVVIAYELDAAALLLASRAFHRATRRIVHLHEVPDAVLHARSRVSSLARRYLMRQANRADLVVVADEHRAELLMEEWKLARRPTVVMNCPLRLERIPESRLLPLAESRGLPTSDIVHYQGALGADHGLEEVIRSMPSWPAASVLALVGGGPPGVVERLQRIAAEARVTERILWVGRVPYEDVFAYAVGAQVGLSVLAPTNNNWRYAAGASNKRFEYAALGIPQVTNQGPGIDTLFTCHGIATAVAPTDVGAIGDAVCEWLADRDAATAAGARARRLHLDRYNYETQFAPVLRQVDRWGA